MAPSDHIKSKVFMASMDTKKFNSFVDNGMHYQYMLNTLQLNNGDNTFSEIGQLAGIDKTEWSWASIFLDIDFDGNKDLFINNGIKESTNDNDLNEKLQKRQKELKKKKPTKKKKPVAELKLWSKDTGRFYPERSFGYGTSPLLAGGNVVVTSESQGEGFIAAFDSESGEEVWRTIRTAERSSHGTPVLANINGSIQIVLNGADRIAGYAPESGKEIWSF